MRSRTASPPMDPSTDSIGKERQRVVVILPAYNEKVTIRSGIDGAVFNEPRHGKGNAVRWAFMTRKDPQSERGQA